MKKILITILAGFLILGCKEDDTFLSVPVEPDGRGITLRTLVAPETTINKTDATNAVFEVKVEVLDHRGLGFSSVDVFADLQDNSPGNGTTDVNEVSVASFTPGEFGTNADTGNPEITITIPFQQVLDSWGIPSTDVDGGDIVSFRLAVTSTDGSTWSSDNSSLSVANGGFHTSPFEYNATIICVLPEVPAGEWVIDMHDTYGDGWQTDNGNGGSGITITLSTGEVFEVGLCTPYIPNDYECVDGDYEGTDTIIIPPGVESAEWVFPGDWYGEISFEIYAPSGNLVASGGLNTPAGPIALNLCNETF